MVQEHEAKRFCSVPHIFMPVMTTVTVLRFISDDVSKVAFLTMTLHQGGSTWMYELKPDSQPSLLSTFSGDRRFSRFGGVLHLSDLDNDGLGRKGMVALAFASEADPLTGSSRPCPRN